MQIFNNTYMNFMWIVLDTRVILFITPHPTPPPPHPPQKNTPKTNKTKNQQQTNKTNQNKFYQIHDMIEFKK